MRVHKLKYGGYYVSSRTTGWGAMGVTVASCKPFVIHWGAERRGKSNARIRRTRSFSRPAWRQ